MPLTDYSASRSSTKCSIGQSNDTFHVLYPPMMQPEHLVWMVNPSSLDEEGKILAVLKILRGLRMTVMDLMLHSISQRPSMETWREGFFRSNALVQFLNVLGTDERASTSMSVYNPLLSQWLLKRLTLRWRPLNIFFICHRKMSPQNYSSRLTSTHFWQSYYKKPLCCYDVSFCQVCASCQGEQTSECRDGKCFNFILELSSSVVSLKAHS
jgi:hypothetical protein